MTKFAFAALAFISQLAVAQTTWLTPDFQITQVPDSARPMGAEITTDCRAKIAKAVCVVDPANGVSPADRVCLDGSANYAPPFEALYDRFPKHLQKMFCRLDRIFIEKKFEATAYAGHMVNSNNEIVGSIMGIRKDFMDMPVTIGHWSSWKEQLNFGGDPSNYEINPALPMIHSSSPDMLYFVVAHEFGHMFDFANSIQKTWLDLSWTPSKDAKPGNDFSLRKSLCFYWCNGHHIDPKQAKNLYDGLFSTNFISIYAASNPMDDWAETLAYYTLREEVGGSYGIHLQDASHFDAMKHLNSPLMAEKMAYLKKFLLGNPKYPGDK